MHHGGYPIGTLGARQLPVAVWGVRGQGQQEALLPGLVIHGQPTAESAATVIPVV